MSWLFQPPNIYIKYIHAHTNYLFKAVVKTETLRKLKEDAGKNTISIFILLSLGISWLGIYKVKKYLPEADTGMSVRHKLSPTHSTARAPLLLFLNDQCFRKPSSYLSYFIKAMRVEWIWFKATGLKASYVPNPTRLTSYMTMF